jgi:hypothetical protein
MWLIATAVGTGETKAGEYDGPFDIAINSLGYTYVTQIYRNQVASFIRSGKERATK